MKQKFEPTASHGRYTGIGVIALLHVALGYALISGLARQAVEAIKKPMEAVLIQEVQLPPPPPPPPKVSEPVKMQAPMPPADTPPPFVPPPEVAPPPTAAPAIESTATPPALMPAIAPPAPAEPPPAPAAPAKSDIALACPTQVAPQVPEKAVRDGLSGVVRAQATVRGGLVRDVTILSGPRVFHAAVRVAMEQYRCSAADGTVAVQEFSFKVE